MQLGQVALDNTIDRTQDSKRNFNPAPSTKKKITTPTPTIKTVP